MGFMKKAKDALFGKYVYNMTHGIGAKDIGGSWMHGASQGKYRQGFHPTNATLPMPAPKVPPIKMGPMQGPHQQYGPIYMPAMNRARPTPGYAGVGYQPPPAVGPATPPPGAVGRASVPQESYSKLAMLGIGSAVGLGAAWYAGNNKLEGTAFGGAVGLGMAMGTGNMAHMLRGGIARGAAWAGGSNMGLGYSRRAYAGLRHMANAPTNNQRKIAAGLGGALVGGAFASHNGHNRKASGFNRSRGNYIGY